MAPRDPKVRQPDGAILVAQEIARSYGERLALRSLSFSLRRGRVLGFLGPNGAGKTTAIRVLTTILEPTAGRFEVDGIGSEHPVEIRRRIGVLPEGLGFPRNTSGIDYLTYFGELFGRPGHAARRTGYELLAEVGLQNRAESLVGTYSHGMRQRLGIARALVNEPRVVFLDEPTLGLDPRGQQELLAMIQRIARERNAGVVLSSHLLDVIEDICDDVVIMNAGRVVAKGTVAEVIGASATEGGHQNVLRIRVPAALIGSAQGILERSPGAGAVSVADAVGGWISTEIGGPGDRESATPEIDRIRNAVLAALIAADIPIIEVETGGGRLQDVFLQLTAEAIV